jgi:formate hydrogenlyase transcriptional activator
MYDFNLTEPASISHTRNTFLLDDIRNEHDFGDIIGNSLSLRKVMQRVQLVAPTDATVLLTGESGTGKELIARAIHKRSRRYSRVLVSVNCAAIPQALIASELFGHEKGAFTGALQRHLGRFEIASGGTILLDEVGVTTDGKHGLRSCACCRNESWKGWAEVRRFISMPA